MGDVFERFLAGTARRQETALGYLGGSSGMPSLANVPLIQAEYR
jgi:hypothetical protein